MPSDTSKQNEQDQQASELQSDQLDDVVGGRAPVIGGTRKPGGGKTGDPCAGGE
jgi:hypothetical protein